MASIPEEASGSKTRVGFRDSTPSDSLLPIRSWSKKHNFIPPKVTCAVEDDDNCITSTPRFDLSLDPSFWKDHNVQVIIRIRPLNTSEISLYGCRRCIRQENFQTVTWTGHTESRFTFDVVADESITQENLFKFSGLPMVDNCIAGYNSCMFAYGQTGSGKTHTMLGDIEGGTQRSNVNCGMTPRVFEYLFLRMQREKEARRDENLIFSCKCSFLEIYNEQILDLLDPSSSNLQIREDINKGVHVESLKEIEVKTTHDVIQQLMEGSANRKVAATNMNRASSRSHCVFTCTIESKWEVQGVKRHRYARLNLVDLAGSERQKSSGAEGDRFKEATNINKSLSTLGLVIMNLVSMSNKKSLHVPYRDSKLTFLLQDSLGGNAKTIIIANISPSSCCSLETLSTLKFAQRAKFIKNNAVVNEDSSGDVIAMKMQIQQLKKEVSQLRGLAGEESYDHITNANTSYLGSSWEGLHGDFSSVVADNMSRQKMEYEVALLGAFKRDKDKEAMLQVLTAENNAILKLAKQRENEIQAVKLRLRLREAGMKRLESVISREMPAETHFLEEKEEHLKEIELLRKQVDRNQEVTRFAMENLRLKEDLKELKCFLEEGGRDFMNEQIKILQNKLIEALDWKFMNQSDPSSIIDTLNSVHSNGSQVVHNVLEMDMMQQKLNSCLRDKEKLERRIEQLETEQGQHSSSSSSRRSCAEKSQQTADDDKVELGSVVDAIAAVSKKQTEGHEAAIIFLSKENDELRAKLKVLIEDNNKLIELCEQAVSDHNNNSGQGGDIELKETLESVEKKLEDMHEENERLISLYELAMQERDQFKRMACNEDMKNLVENVRLQLDRTRKNAINLVKAIPILTEIQKSGVEFNGVSDEIDKVSNDIRDKQREYEYLKECYLGISGRMSVCSRKLSALKCCVSKSMCSLDYFQKRDAQGKEKTAVAMLHSKKKREALARLHIEKGEIEKVLMDAQKAEAEHRDIISRTMSKLDVENKRRKTEMTGPASEMLQWEEEKARLGSIMRKEKEGFGRRIKEIEDGRRKVGRIEREMQELEAEMEKGLRVVEEMEGVRREKAMVLDFIMAGNEEMEKTVGELVHHVVDAVLREGEIIIVEEQVREMTEILELLKIGQKREKMNHCSLLNTERIREDLESIEMGVTQACFMLENYATISPPIKIT